jgi:hypothetical protein
MKRCQRIAVLAIMLASVAPAAVAQPVETTAPVATRSPPPPPPPPPPASLRAPAAAYVQTKPTIEAGGFLSREDWWRCDGYNPPDRRSDAMTSVRNLLVSAEASRSQPRIGQGVAVCDAALADPRMLPQWTRRRANILQARAMHKAEAGDAAGALADLDESDRLLGTETYARRSIGANSRLVRAWAQLKSGQAEAAAKTAREAMALRPWEPGYRHAAARLHLAATSDWIRFIEDNREISRIDPNRLVGLYAVATLRGDWETSAALYPQIVLTVPRNRGGFEVQGLLARRVEQMQARAELHGLYAYSLAALGRQADARREMGAARAALEAQLTPPKPIGRRTELTRDQREEFAAFTTGSVQARASLDRLDLLVGLRGQLAEGEAEAVFTRLMEAKPGVDGVTLDLVRALAKAAPEHQAELGELAAMMEGVIARMLDETRKIKLSDLFEAMPEPEDAEGLPAYDGGSDSFLSLDHNGYRTHEGVIEGTETIRFASMRGSVATANEMVLLRAAELARKKGHRGFVLVGRRGLIRQVVTVGPWSAGGATPSGQEAEVDVAFVDPTNLPASYAAAGWRVLDADEVWNELSPLYPPPRRK